MMKFAFKLFLLLSFMGQAQGQELNLLTWNVFMLPKPIKYSNQKVRTQAIAEALKDTSYDFIFMQEAFTGSFQKKVGKALKEKYPYQYYLKRKHFYSIYGSGVFVLAKHPFKVIGKDYFDKCAAADCYATKGVVLIESTLPDGKTIQLASSHLQSKEKHGAIRLKQIQEIKALLNEHQREGVPQFLMGDLNIDVVEPEFPEALSLLEMETTDLSGEITHTNVIDCYRKPESELERIDHILYSRDLNLKEVHLEVRPFMYFAKDKGQCVASDHYAVEGRFIFN